MYQQIANLNLATLDRLHRFIRLANKLQWSFADLDWALRSIQPAPDTKIDVNAIKNLAKIKKLQEGYDLPVAVLCSFWDEMKTVGLGDTPTPQDLFDRTFNQPTVFSNPQNLADPLPYHPQYSGNPLYKEPVLNWGVADRNGANAQIRSRLGAALSVSDDDLTWIANRVDTGSGIPLTVPNLTRLYRFSKLAAVLGLRVSEYLLLLDLIKKPEVTSIDDVIQVTGCAEWLKESGLTVYQLNYMTGGAPGQYVDPGYVKDDVKPMLEALSKGAENWLVGKNAFVHGNSKHKR